MSLFDRGDRGPTGDHGQDGKTGDPGQRGERGATGIPGGASPDDLDRLVVQMTGEALALERRRWISRQSLATYAFVVFACLVLFLVVDTRFQEFRRAVIMACERDNAQSQLNNAELDLQKRTVLTNPARTPADRQRIAEGYDRLRQPVSDCPP